MGAPPPLVFELLRPRDRSRDTLPPYRFVVVARPAPRFDARGPGDPADPRSPVRAAPAPRPLTLQAPVDDTGIFAPLALPEANALRRPNGAPGAAYWQQRADYRLKATLDTAAKRLTGQVTIRYTNNSPDTLTHRLDAAGPEPVPSGQCRRSAECPGEPVWRRRVQWRVRHRQLHADARDSASRRRTRRCASPRPQAVDPAGR